MPAEWAPHRATWLSWPHNLETWPSYLEKVQDIWVRMVAALSPHEQVFLLVNDAAVKRDVAARLNGAKSMMANVTAVALLPMGGQNATGRSIPTSAIVRRGALTGVFLFAPDSTIRLRWVRLGRTLGKDVAVLSGLQDGDLVVQDGSAGRDGARAEPLLGGEAVR